MIVVTVRPINDYQAVFNFHVFGGRDAQIDTCTRVRQVLIKNYSRKKNKPTKSFVLLETVFKS